jgi:hypothetical protein
MKTDTPTKKKALRTGLTEMRKEKHKYDGYLVRRSRFNHKFHRYIGACSRLMGKADAAERFGKARTVAAAALRTLDSILLDPNAWRVSLGKKHLTKKAALALTRLGFKIKSPAP